MFLPEDREGYKYLGLTQKERDMGIKEVRARTAILDEVTNIMDSRLSPPQKIHLINTASMPAATYILGNIHPEEQQCTTLLKSRSIDKDIRKILVDKGLKRYSMPTHGVYIPTEYGGLGLESIEDQIELQQVRKTLYLLLQYNRLEKYEWKNPITDAERILEKYGNVIPQLPGEPLQNTTTTGESCRRTTKFLAEKQLECRIAQRNTNSHYGNLISRNRSVQILVMRSKHLKIWMSCLIRAAMEEQIMASGSIPDRRMCPRGCRKTLTSYHVATACITHEYTERHDFAVYWITKNILQAMEAPDDTKRLLQFGSGTIVANFDSKSYGQTRIRAGGYIATDVNLNIQDQEQIK